MKYMTFLGMLFLSSSHLSHATCPHNDLITAKLDDFANHGKATIEAETYHLVGRDATNIFYQYKLLENDVQLNGFISVSRLFDNNLPKPHAQLIALVPTPNFCAYEIALGEKKQVIAITTAP
jgi:hypothetical protein